MAKKTPKTTVRIDRGSVAGLDKVLAQGSAAGIKDQIYWRTQLQDMVEQLNSAIDGLDANIASKTIEATKADMVAEGIISSLEEEPEFVVVVECKDKDGHAIEKIYKSTVVNKHAFELDKKIIGDPEHAPSELTRVVTETKFKSSKEIQAMFDDGSLPAVCACACGYKDTVVVKTGKPTVERKEE